MQNTSVLIPAFKPALRLVDIIDRLSEAYPGQIVIVDDGSGDEYQHVFDQCASKARTTVIRNAVNLGKGAALKHGINHILTTYSNNVGIITADADGQHAVPDIINVARRLSEKQNALVLGSREFGGDIPFRSKLGNNISRIVYRGLLGLNLRDTQTGLRGLSSSFARACLSIRSNRYEFETEQLSLAASRQVPISEVMIQTIYEDHNASSHFNPLLDSARIYFVVLRYGFSSIATTVVDMAAFVLLLPFLPNVIVTTLASRAISICVQFPLLKRFVFHSSGGVKKFGLFVGYVALTGLVSGVLQRELSQVTGAPAVASKVSIETVIFIFNFLFLRDILFRKSPRKK